MAFMINGRRVSRLGGALAQAPSPVFTQAQAIDMLNRLLLAITQRIQVSGDYQIDKGEPNGPGVYYFRPAEFDGFNAAWRQVTGRESLLLSSGRLASSVRDEMRGAGFPRPVPGTSRSRLWTGLAIGGGVLLLLYLLTD